MQITRCSRGHLLLRFSPWWWLRLWICCGRRCAKNSPKRRRSKPPVPLKYLWRNSKQMGLQRACPNSDDQYLRLCADNPNLRIERTADGRVPILPPVGGESSYQNSELSAQLRDWARRDGRG